MYVCMYYIIRMILRDVIVGEIEWLAVVKIANSGI